MTAATFRALKGSIYCKKCRWFWRSSFEKNYKPYMGVCHIGLKMGCGRKRTCVHYEIKP